MILYHYTCEHAAAKIVKNGQLVGWPHRFLPLIGPIIWLTDLDQVARDEKGLDPLGLAPIQLKHKCDRLGWRVDVDIAEPIRWASWARRHPAITKTQVTSVETNARGTLIAHWYISLERVPILAATAMSCTLPTYTTPRVGGGDNVAVPDETTAGDR